jgi:hypothetical protein
MEYQLVIQFRLTAELDFEKLVAIEDAIIDELGDSASVDGHDIASGEFNIFIVTDDARGSYQRLQMLLQQVKPDGVMNVAYREADDEEYVILWPPNQTEFTII